MALAPEPLEARISPSRFGDNPATGNGGESTQQTEAEDYFKMVSASTLLIGEERM